MRIRTRRQADQVLERWARLLVPEWNVGIDWDRFSAPPCSAHVSFADSYLAATITLEPGWLERQVYDRWDPDYEREVDLVHELLHLVTRDLKQHDVAVREQLGTEAAAIAAERWDHAIEGAVERMARALVAVSREGAG